MMIKYDKFLREDGVPMIHRYSDRKVKIRQNETGKPYDDAVDVDDGRYSYSETDEKIESEVVIDESITED